MLYCIRLSKWPPGSAAAMPKPSSNQRSIDWYITCERCTACESRANCSIVGTLSSCKGSRTLVLCAESNERAADAIKLSAVPYMAQLPGQPHAGSGEPASVFKSSMVRYLITPYRKKSSTYLGVGLDAFPLPKSNCVFVTFTVYWQRYLRIPYCTSHVRDNRWLL
eukprot:7389587-Prymnesium_polylepis.1